MKSLPPRHGFVVEFPDDNMQTLYAVVALAGQHGGVTYPTLQWLLRFQTFNHAFLCKACFGHFGFTADGQLVVPEEDRPDVKDWLAEQTEPMTVEWTYLEDARPCSLEEARDWANAYYQVVGRPPRLRRLPPDY